MGIQIISFHCTLKNRLGRVISSTFNQDVITQSPHAQDMLVGLAEGLKDLRKGESRKICLRADQAYGFYDPTKVLTKRRDEVPNGDRLRVGDQVGMRPSKVGEKYIVYRIIETTSDQLIMDGNHPLAGQDLVFEIETVDARDATPAEISECVVENETTTIYH
jgi:FKBP-type peptidyl-prolyl cis-trans isomerase SlyD